MTGIPFLLLCIIILSAMKVVTAAVLSNMVNIHGLIGGSKKLGSFMLQRQIDIDVLPNENMNLGRPIARMLSG